MRWGVRWTSSDGKRMRRRKSCINGHRIWMIKGGKKEEMKELDEIVLKRSDGILSLQEFKWTFCPDEDRKEEQYQFFHRLSSRSSYSLDQVNRNTTSSFLTQNHGTVCPLHSSHFSFFLLLPSILWSDLFFIIFFYSFQSGDPREEFQIFFSFSFLINSFPSKSWMKEPSFCHGGKEVEISK